MLLRPYFMELLSPGWGILKIYIRLILLEEQYSNENLSHDC